MSSNSLQDINRLGVEFRIACKMASWSLDSLPPDPLLCIVHWMGDSTNVAKLTSASQRLRSVLLSNLDEFVFEMTRVDALAIPKFALHLPQLAHFSFSTRKGWETVKTTLDLVSLPNTLISLRLSFANSWSSVLENQIRDDSSPCQLIDMANNFPSLEVLEIRSANLIPAIRVDVFSRLPRSLQTLTIEFTNTQKIYQACMWWLPPSLTSLTVPINGTDPPLFGPPDSAVNLPLLAECNDFLFPPNLQCLKFGYSYTGSNPMGEYPTFDFAYQSAEDVVQKTYSMKTLPSFVGIDSLSTPLPNLETRLPRSLQEFHFPFPTAAFPDLNSSLPPDGAPQPFPTPRIDFLPPYLTTLRIDLTFNEPDLLRLPRTLTRLSLALMDPNHADLLPPGLIEFQVDESSNNFQWSRQDFECFLMKAPTSIRVLNDCFAEYFDESSIKRWSYCPPITQFEISSSWKYGHPDWVEPMLKKNMNLKTVTVHYPIACLFPILPPSITALAVTQRKFCDTYLIPSSIRELRLSLIGIENCSEFIAPISKMPNLTVLQLGNGFEAAFITEFPKTLTSLLIGSVLEKNQDLKSLDLSPEEAKIQYNWPPCLTELNITVLASCCNKTANRWIESCLSVLPDSLGYLRLSFIGNEIESHTKAPLTHGMNWNEFSRHLPRRMSSLLLSDADNWTDEAIQSLPRGLTTLVLSGSTSELSLEFLGLLPKHLYSMTIPLPSNIQDFLLLPSSEIMLRLAPKYLRHFFVSWQDSNRGRRLSAPSGFSTVV